MKTSALAMNFAVDKENKKIRVDREFSAMVSAVWDAWTKKELLDQWWAPKPWQTRTKTLDFSEGGFWLYAMVGPDNSEQWCRADYKSIVPIKNFTSTAAFCDGHGKVDSSFPIPAWLVEFNDNRDSTRVNIEIRFESLADLEKYIELGFREGFTAALENLDTLLDS
jgi:uncharacterized protein YndB with AHSA1/START domain